MKTTAIIFTAPGHVELADIQLPDPTGQELLVETMLTAISPGTERRVLSGGQAGATFPLVPGYMNLGRVIGRAPGARPDIPDGTLVFSGGSKYTPFCRRWGGHVGHAVTDAVFAVGTHTSPKAAVIAKLCAISFQGTRHSLPTMDDRVAVVGLGPIGQLSARIHAISGASVTGFDISPERVALARRAGCEAVVIEGSLTETGARQNPGGYDVVVDATGALPVLQHSIRILRDRAWTDPPASPGVRLLIQGSYPGSISFDYLELFMKGAILHLPRDCQPNDIQSCLNLMERGVLRVEDLISRIDSPQNAPEVFAMLSAPAGDYMTSIFDWRKNG